MKTRKFVWAIMVIAGLSGCSSKVDKPNILLIYSDDQGSIDLNCYGATDLMTPHLDKLAAEGVRFTRFYAGSSLCSPSRAALMTGMSPQKAGLPGNASSQPGHSGLPTERMTIAELVKKAGYATAHIGKWHLGYSDETEPLGQGFDYSFGHMGGCIDNFSHFFYWNGPNQHDLWENNEEIYRQGEYFPDLMVKQAKWFMDEHRHEPFFMYFAINLPHYPLQPTDKWREYYQNLEMPRRDYAAFLSVVDERVGELVSHLEKLNIREHTVIIFQADQGHSCETRAFGGGGNAGPYRGAKSSLFEGGIRIPAILNWPGHLPEGQVNDVALINYDWFPTIAELIGLDSDFPEIEGSSLLPVLDDPSMELHPSLRWKLGRQWAVQQGDWKLLGNPTDPANKFPLRGEEDLLFLVNLKEDPGEAVNLALAYPEKVDELIALYLGWEFAAREDIPEQLPAMNNLAQGASVTGTAPHPNYPGKGLASLVNNKRGSGNFQDGQWLGFEKADAEFKLILNEPVQAQTIAVRCLQDLGSWIFLPTEIEVWATDTQGKESRLGLVSQPEGTEKEEFATHWYKIQCSQKLSGLRLRIINRGQCPDWHPGNGGNAWMFIDEIAVE